LKSRKPVLIVTSSYELSVYSEKKQMLIVFGAQRGGDRNSIPPEHLGSGSGT
jgi:hypothetical protein